MKCPRCQAENDAGARFCEDCGARLEVACAGCGTPVTPGKRFCRSCGAALIAEPAGGFASPKSYTPKHLAEKILTSKSALEGERKQVTVLFCDIVDSSGLAQRLDPEVMHEVMDRVLRLMAEAVHRYEGTVNQFLGDGLMALFGAPVALEDHAFRAVQAALAMRETLSGYSEQLKRERGVGLRLRLGLNTGLVVVGRIGDDLRMDYTAVGDTTNLAARMQALAEPGTILIAEATHRLLEGYVRSEALGPVQVKGWSERVSVYKVTGWRQGRTRLEVSAERGLTQLVGRQQELGVLRDCLARVKAGRGQVVGIVGEPGVGKSRLLYEFKNSLGGERVTWLEGHCVAYGQTTPYLPVLDILRANFQIEDGDNQLQIREKLLHRGLRQLDPAQEGVLPFLGELFGLPGDESLKFLDPRDKRKKTFEAIRSLAVAGSQLRPLVVVVEDLHWIDKTSEDYFAFLIESLAGLSLLLLTTLRPGYAVRWGDKTFYTQLALDLLTEDETEAMVTALVESRDIPLELVRFVRERAEGNPLFVEEITAALLERGAIVRQNGGFRWAGTAGAELPATIQDIIRARIDRLEEPVKRTVQTAAVIGREFGVRLLTRISEVAEEVERYLDTLRHLEMIHEKHFFPELEYIFKHAVTQDVAYQSLLVPRRKELHGAIGRVMEELYADRVEEHAAILAYHYSRSERQDKAVEYSLLAGNLAARFYANGEATTYFQQAHKTARSLPPSPEAQRAEIDAAVKLATVGVTRQDIERDRENLAQARDLADALHDEPRLALVLYWLGRIHYLLSDPQRAINYARQSLEIAERLRDDALAAPPVNLMGRAYWQLADFAKSAPMMERSAEQMRRVGNKSEESTAVGFAGWVLGLMGEFDRALAHTDHAIELAQEVQNPFAEAAAYQYRALIRDQRGEWTQGVADLQGAGRVAERAGDLVRVYIVKAWEGRAHAMAGDPDRGRALVEESLALSTKIGANFARQQQKAHLATCLLALGQPDAALHVCEEAVGHAEESGDKWIRALAFRTFAEASSVLYPSDAQKAETALVEAIRLLQEIGAKPELARTYVSYACLLDVRGDRTRAMEYLTPAIDMFRGMGMVWDLERAERALSGH